MCTNTLIHLTLENSDILGSTGLKVFTHPPTPNAHVRVTTSYPSLSHISTYHTILCHFLMRPIELPLYSPHGLVQSQHDLGSSFSEAHFTIICQDLSAVCADDTDLTKLHVEAQTSTDERIVEKQSELPCSWVFRCETLVSSRTVVTLLLLLMW